MSKSFKIITLGCKVNQYESAFLEESLVNLGCRKVGQDRAAELVVINTCIVTARASYQSRQAIRRAIRENPEAVVAVTGCYGQVFPGELSRIEGLDVITGNVGKNSLPDVLIRTTQHNAPLVTWRDFGVSMPFEEIPIKWFRGRTRAFLKIQDGCESFCAYCIVPKARGPLRSLKLERAITNLRDFKQNGYKEVVLTGIHLGNYGSDLSNGTGLIQLLTEIDKNRLGLRIRLSSLEPTEIDRELIELMASNEWLCRHFHISLQSGDDSVLRRMNRHYTAKLATKVIEDIARSVPAVSIGVDVLVGFPGETERAFLNTLGFLGELPITYMHVFPYSRRQGTAAASFNDHLDTRIIKERAYLLRKLDRTKRGVFWNSLMGQTFQVLTEGWAPGGADLARGLSDNYVRFTFPTKQISSNEIVKVRAIGITGTGVSAVRVGD
jgi:threonylcarbamoyladenosine tRNA methylthiotransferase MtaB